MKMQSLTKEKLNAMIMEVKEYLPYDDNIDESIIRHFKDFTLNEYERFIYDYFFSHINSFGENISLERFLKGYRQGKEYDMAPDKYKDINTRFLKNLFAKNKPLFFFDVDNTLTDLGVLSKEKEQYLKNFPEKQRIILSTGKAYESISDVVSKCGLEGNTASCICGSVIYDNKELIVINKLGEVSKDLIEEIKKINIEFMFYYKDGSYTTYNLNDKNTEWIHKYNEYNKIVKDIDYDNVIKILLFIYENEKDKEKCMKEVAKKYDGIHAVRTGHHCMEFLKKDQHKGNTVKLIAKKLGVYYRCSIGCGDSMNDLSMLDHVGKPYIVDTSSRELKAYDFDKLSKDRNVDIIELMESFK